MKRLGIIVMCVVFVGSGLAYANWFRKLGPTTSGYTFHVHQSTDTIYYYSQGMPDPASNEAWTWPPSATISVSVHDANYKWVDGVQIEMTAEGQLKGQVEISPSTLTTQNGKAMATVSLSGEGPELGEGKINVKVENIVHGVNLAIEQAPVSGF